jgi:hypothetical protein
VRIVTRARVEPGARVVIRVRDARGALSRLHRRDSRVNGRVPQAVSGGNGFTVVAPASGIVNLAIVSPGRPASALKRSRLELVATDTAGERSALAKGFLARMSLGR